MDEQVEGPLGLVILYEGQDPKIDIVAVHGLGANPAWAWIYKVGDQKINWLKDDNLLPHNLPHARIMVFNYESRWHADAPWQRRSLCADQLLTALNTQRKQEKIDVYRPLIFIGHSFGGIVIEQALVNASVHGGPFQYLATSTVGIVFLGTPHRGTKAAKWGELIAKTGSAFGFSTESRILRDLNQDSEALTDLLYTFTSWLFRLSVPTVCFFEQYKTNYGGKVKGLVSWEEMVVDERSACIDGHRKVALPMDHFKINKFKGPADPSFQNVAGVIVEMAEDADQKVHARLYPREIIQDNSIVPKQHMACLRSLMLTNPADDLRSIRRIKGKRARSTCEWLFAETKYNNWSTGSPPQLLRLIGDAGIGKTMMSTFLVDELQERARQNPSVTLAYFFCDNKFDKSKTSTAVLRGLMLQILRQRPKLFTKIEADYDLMQHELGESFDALARNFRAILCSHEVGELYLLIDGLDECEYQSRPELLHTIKELYLEEPWTRKHKSKLMLTHRPQVDIDSWFTDEEHTLRITSAKIDSDLATFINERVEELSQSRQWSKSLEEKVKSELKNKAGGTFLWASLVLDDLGKTTSNGDVRKKLTRLPVDLYGVYDRILDDIRGEDIENTVLILQLLVVARRPLTVGELAMACTLALDQANGEIDLSEDMWKDRKDVFRCCGALVYRDRQNDTVNFIHQSVKDYLTDNLHLPNTKRAKYRAVMQEADQLLFRLCWTYLGIDQFDHGLKIIAQGRGGCLIPQTPQSEGSHMQVFVQYAAEQYWEHALAAGDVFAKQDWHQETFAWLPTLRDWLLLQAARNGKVSVVRTLLDNGADVKAKTSDGETAMHWATAGSHVEVVQLLLNQEPHVISVDNDRRTAMHWTVIQHNEIIAQQLAMHQEGSYLPIRDAYGWTALYLAVRMAEWSGDASKAIAQILLRERSDPNLQTYCGKTALHDAAAFGLVDLARLLLQHGARTDIKDGDGKTASNRAIESGFQDMVQLLDANTSLISPPAGLDSAWTTSLRPGLSRIFMKPKERLDHRTYMHLYDTVHSHCTYGPRVWSEEDQEYQYSEPRGELYGADLYDNLKRYLAQHLKELTTALVKQDDEEMPSFYAREWGRYIAAATQVAKIFSYLNNHWIKRELDEGRKNIFRVYEEHLVEWRTAFFPTPGEGIIVTTLKLLEQQGDSGKPEIIQLKTIWDSILTLWGPELSSYDDSFTSGLPHPIFEKAFWMALAEYYPSGFESLIKWIRQNALTLIKSSEAGRQTEVLELGKQVVELQKLKLGPDHPDTLRSIKDLADYYSAAGRQTEALELRKQVIKLKKQVMELQKQKLGPDHPDTLYLIKDLADHYSAAGQKTEALELRKQEVERQKQKLGPDHPDTLRSIRDLAGYYSAAGQETEALELRKQVVDLQKQKLGPDHPDTLRSIRDLAGYYSRAGQKTEALELIKQVVERQKQKLGPDHPALRLIRDLADYYSVAGQETEALELMEQVVELQK